MNKKYAFLLLLISIFSCDVNNEITKQTDTSYIAESSDKFNVVPVNLHLPKELNEQSGLLYYKSLFWAINDSFKESILYAFDSEGIIHRQILLLSQNGSIIDNIDWEDITEDDDFIYIGDFGNNKGNRKDLCILKLSKESIADVKVDKAKVEIINFSWNEQSDFTTRSYKHNFDCEALLSMGDNLYLFTKNWLNNKTSMYVLPKKKGNYNVSAKSYFDIGFMITGADISCDNKSICLVGYKNYKTYVRTFTDFKGDDFFNGRSEFYYLESLGRAQTEGIAYDSDNKVFISTEENSRDNLHQSIYELKIIK